VLFPLQYKNVLPHHKHVLLHLYIRVATDCKYRPKYIAYPAALLEDIPGT